MTTQVVWLCRDCDLPVTFTCDYRVHAEPHIHAHQAQHRQ